MGSSSSKFKKYIQHGDEFAAMQIYQSSPELRKNLDPNLSYGESHQHYTALHYAAKHGMKHLLRMFVMELGGDPNKRNARNETGLHCCCDLASTHRTYSAQERRASCVSLLLQWRGPQSSEQVDIDAQDIKGNTALHVAASNGLQRCVQLLLAHGASVFIENKDKMTPCDLAVQADHHHIARILESTIVFAESGSNTVNEAEVQSLEEVYCGLRTQDLQEAKDQLLVDTSDMFNIPLFTAETLLRDNEWSKEALLERWMWDAAECCRSAGVPPPPWTSPHRPQPHPQSPDHITKNFQCEICLMLVGKSKTVGMSCGHRFCTDCWSAYLTSRIQAGNAVGTPCPAVACDLLVPHDLIETLVSPDVANKYLQFDIKEFVERNRCIKWCPMAGCGRAVRLPEAELMSHQDQTTLSTSHAVDCGNGHFFCWECLGEAHAPASCADWRRWLTKIRQVKPEELDATQSWNRSEDAANCLWLVSNSKPCPNCNSPIQKNEGCNHMKCSKCKFDFCWVCLEAWKRHGSATGGYFRCNRFEAVTKADEKQGLLITEALVRSQESCELARFLHYYTRFKNHENSRTMEEPLLTMAKHKMRVLAASLSHSDKDTKCTKFIEEGIRELLKARKILCGSYVYGYYLEDTGPMRSIFEFMQNELEEVVESLSEMVARPYLKTRKSVIVETARLARRKRHEFSRAVSRGWLPPDTPTHIPHKCEGTCARDGCPFPKDRTASSNYCSVQCSQLDKVYRLNVTRDENTELAIALEMSRLQMIEDQLKMSQKQEETRTVNRIIPNTVSVQIEDQGEGGSGEGKEAKNEVKDEGGRSVDQTVPTVSYEETTVVDSFLKSLAKFDLNSISTEPSNTLWTKTHNPTSKRRGEDGRFQIGELHEACVFTRQGESRPRLSKSLSTGDLTHPSLLRFELDSGHWRQHRSEGRVKSGGPVEVTPVRAVPVRAAATPPRTSTATPPRTSTATPPRTSTATPPRTSTATPPRTSTATPPRTSTATPPRTSAATPPRTSATPPRVSATPPRPAPTPPPTLITQPSPPLSANIERSPEGDYSVYIEAASDGSDGGGTRSEIISWQTLNPNSSPKKVIEKENTKKKERNSGKQLTIRIYNPSSGSQAQPLETDSSYESETGIPKSPTLFISGVSISRSPELGRSPLVRQSRSSSLTEAKLESVYPRHASSYPTLDPPAHDSPHHVFRFPKSSTDGALSSVLHVQESNLSSDDFHEALFLLDSSPRGSKRRKRNKKERPSKEEVSSQL